LFLIAARTGSEATHAAALTLVAAAVLELVVLVFLEEELDFFELVEEIFLELVLAARATSTAPVT
jgi:hypothetical protein